MNARLLASGAVLAIAAALGAAFALAHDTAGSAADSGARLTSPAGAGLTVRPGEGAAAVAANGFTPIGYPSTCKGAVAAIASAEQMLSELGAVKGVTTEQWRRTIEGVYGKDTAISTYYLGIVGHATGDASIQRVARDHLSQLAVTTHPEWGGFRVVACRPGDSATVELLTCNQIVADQHTACYAAARQARWSGTPGDWVVQDYQTADDVVAPALRERIDNDADALQGSAPPAGKRAQWLAALGSGWQQFSNAPR